MIAVRRLVIYPRFVSRIVRFCHVWFAVLVLDLCKLTDDTVMIHLGDVADG